MPEGEAQFLWQKYEATGHIMVATGRRKWDQRQGQLKASNVSLTDLLLPARTSITNSPQIYSQNSASSWGPDTQTHDPLGDASQ